LYSNIIGFLDSRNKMPFLRALKRLQPMSMVLNRFPQVTILLLTSSSFLACMMHH